MNKNRKGMSIIVKTITRLIAPFIVIYGMYIVLYGHLTPGGGFAGGVIWACSLVLILLAFGKEMVVGVVKEKTASIWDSIGAFGFLAMAILGYVGGTFFYNFLPKGRLFALVSGGTLPINNIFIGVKVAAALFVVFLTISVYRLSQNKAQEENV